MAFTGGGQIPRNAEQAETYCDRYDDYGLQCWLNIIGDAQLREILPDRLYGWDEEDGLPFYITASMVFDEDLAFMCCGALPSELTNGYDFVAVAKGPQPARTH